MDDGENLLGSRQATARAVASALLGWYDRERRELPWRAAPGTRPDPYAVWLSEIMLQQTVVKAAIPYYAKFLARWPAAAALARAPREEVMRAWAGLGYYSRARNMHLAARIVADELGGRFPDTIEGLQALPGVGPYTAAAIAAIAFDRPVAVVDGNVERVVARLFAFEEPLPGAKRRLRALAGDLTPDERPGDFAQAMMDLGAGVCTPKRPACGHCPLTGACAGRARGIAALLPYREPRPEKPRRRGNAYFALGGDGAVLLRRRPEKGLLGAMMEVPSSGWSGQETWPDAGTGASPAPFEGDWRRLPGGVRHTFTHFHLELEVWGLRLPAGERPLPEGGGARWRWVERADLAGEALPSLMRKVVAHALGHLDGRAD